MNFFTKSTLAVAILVATSCSHYSTNDNIQATEIVVPEAWQYALPADVQSKIVSNWWESFKSQQLTDLVVASSKNNPDVRIAGEHIKQAELQMKIANASLFPFLNASVSSGERGTRSPAGGDWINSGSSSASLSMSYELDVWGAENAARNSSKLSALSTRYSNQSALITINASVTTSWFSYLALQERLRTASKNLEIAQRIQHIVDIRYQNGAASAADLAQQSTNVLNQQNALLPLQLQSDQSKAAIAVLTGVAPQGFDLIDESLLSISIPNVRAGIPSEVIRQRPDVAAVEAQLNAARANLWVAKTALLPSFQLGASLSRSSSELLDLNPATQARGWSVSLAQAVFAGGRLKNQVALSESKQRELLESYRKVLLTAFQDVDDALHRIQVTEMQENNQLLVIEQAKRSLSLSEIRYREGGIDLQALLSSQQTYFQAEDNYVQQRLTRLRAVVDLYKALGGGWSSTAI